MAVASVIKRGKGTREKEQAVGVGGGGLHEGKGRLGRGKEWRRVASKQKAGVGRGAGAQRRLTIL